MFYREWSENTSQRTWHLGRELRKHEARRKSYKRLEGKIPRKGKSKFKDTDL